MAKPTGENKTQPENVVCVYRDGDIVAIIKRDEKTRKKIVYTVKEADIDDIVELMNSNEIKI